MNIGLINFSPVDLETQSPVLQHMESPLASGPQLIDEIASLRTKLATLETQLFKILPESRDTISFVQADSSLNSALLLAKKNRLSISGSFQRSKLWRDDPFACYLFDNLRKYHDGVQAKILETSQTEQSKDLQKQVRLRKKGRFGTKNIKDNQLSLKAQMEAALPSKDHVLRHVGRFLREIHPFFPVLIEQDFYADINKILTVKNGRIELDISQKSDYLVTATILLAMRFSYQSLFLKQQAGAYLDTEEEQLLEPPVNADVVNLVNYALFESNSLRKSNVCTLQLLILLRNYQVMCQEDGDGGDGTDGYTMNGMICQLGLGMGINRGLRYPIRSKEVSHIYSPSNIEFRLLWTRLWWSCLQMDMEHSVAYGKAPVLLLTNSDHGAETHINDPLVEDRIQKMKALYPMLQKVLVQLHNVTEKPKILDILSALKFLDSQRPLFIQKRIFADPTATLISTISDTISGMRLNTLMFMLDCYLLLHFEKHRMLSDYSTTLQRSVTGCFQLLDLAFSTLNLMKTDFSGHIMQLIHPVATCIYKALQFLIYWGLRLLFMRSKITPKQSTASELLNSVISIMRDCIKVVAILGDQDYLCYRLFENYSFVLKFLEGNGEPMFYLEDAQLLESLNLMDSLTPQQLAEYSETFKKFSVSPQITTVSRYTTFWPANETRDSLFQRFRRTIEQVPGYVQQDTWKDWILNTNIFEDYEGLFADLQFPTDINYM
ncbi:hypothetical protein OGAPHI_000263 [Ogataea philodendri]|uniref:Xylanolytic transcriptional activator regulatory domain-containing protein n=1 Tax=Ogataea philodendri TaxID=1378263 RepID=A0A9P8PHD1_9ASCO|nr:uncharacterized protein OGAPHI_000263 [Ogataea philodendri]KAH3671560.1 hypothetical protein OGAPHI_000263 [Ogataea philodendri]